MSIFTNIAGAIKSLFVKPAASLAPIEIGDSVEEKPVEPVIAAPKVVREYPSNFGVYYVQVEYNGQVQEFGFKGEKPPDEKTLQAAMNALVLRVKEEAALPPPPEVKELNADNAIDYLQEVYSVAAVKATDAKAVLTEEETKVLAFMGGGK